MYGALPAPHVLRSDYEASVLVVDAGMRERMENVVSGGDNENPSSHPTP